MQQLKTETETDFEVGAHISVLVSVFYHRPSDDNTLWKTARFEETGSRGGYGRDHTANDVCIFIQAALSIKSGRTLS